MTCYEKWSIAISALAAIGTIMASVIALRVAHKSNHAFKKKNCEHRDGFIQDISDTGIIFTNISSFPIQVAQLCFTCGSKLEMVTEIYNDTDIISLPYKVLPNESIRIRNVFDAVSKTLIPNNDYSEKNFNYKRFYSMRHIKFLLRDSHGNEYKKWSKYSIAHYLKLYENQCLISPWQISNVENYVSNTGINCFCYAVNRNDFRVFKIKDNNMRDVIIEYLQKFGETSYLLAPAIISMTAEGIRYFTGFNKIAYAEILHLLESKCDQISMEEIIGFNDLLYFKFAFEEGGKLIILNENTDSSTKTPNSKDNKAE